MLELVAALGGDAGMEMHGFRVRPEQFIGLELNQQAVAIAQLVLWIGYFQWQRKTTGKADTGDRPLLPKDKEIHDKGLVTILKEIRDELDAAVLEAYGWSDLKNCSGGLRPSHDCSGGGEAVPHLSGSDGHRPPLQSFEQQLLSRLVALNHERAAEEKRGLIRWLRPDYQAPGASSDGHRPPLVRTHIHEINR